MIDEYYTFRFFGYTSDMLSNCSGKKVVAMCDGCGKYRVVYFNKYRDLGRCCMGHERAERRFKAFLAEHYGKHFCACGCGEVIKIDYECYIHNRFPKYIRGHNSRVYHPMHKPEIDEWVNENTNKHLCRCGCGEFIKIERRFYYKGIPEYIHNHHSNGPNHSQWKGGISFGKYCPKFDLRMKRHIREKYNNCDFMSGLQDSICNRGRKLDVHHIDYNKQQGCDEHEWRLIPLSVSNHCRTNHNRPFWNRLFTYALQYWDEHYDVVYHSSFFINNESNIDRIV